MRNVYIKRYWSVVQKRRTFSLAPILCGFVFRLCSACGLCFVCAFWLVLVIVIRHLNSSVPCNVHCTRHSARSPDTHDLHSGFRWCTLDMLQMAKCKRLSPDSVKTKVQTTQHSAQKVHYWRFGRLFTPIVCVGDEN